MTVPPDHIIDTLQGSISVVSFGVWGIFSVATVVMCGSFDVDVRHNFVNLIATEPVEYFSSYGGLYVRGEESRSSAP